MKSTLYSPTDAVPFNASTGQEIPAYVFAGDGLTEDEQSRLEAIDPVDYDERAGYAGHPDYLGRRFFARGLIGDLSHVRFLWYSHKGERYLPADMATQHLFYALRMVWNHSVPEIWRVGDYPRYADVPNWPESYRRRAITELASELAQREDRLSENIRQQFHEMILKTITILVLGI